MGKQYEQLDEKLIDFIGRQHVFFVGTAPDDPEGRLNISSVRNAKATSTPNSPLTSDHG
jgi:hypothetical protein